MQSIKNILLACLLGVFLLTPVAYGGQGDERDIFAIGVLPDVLILLDGSGSMFWLPSGQKVFYAKLTSNCDQGSYKGPFYKTPSEVPCSPRACIISEPGFSPFYSTDCVSGPFYREAAGRMDCSRRGRAQEGIRQILDADGSGTIDSNDETGVNGLNARLGFTYFMDDAPCSFDGAPCRDIGSRYSDIMSSVNMVWPAGGTPLAYLLQHAKGVLDTSKNADPEKSCRQKFAILITDGADTDACGGNGTNTQPDQYKRRRETVAKTKALYDAGYKVYVIGFGADMPFWEKNTLNWTAFFGGTDNPALPNPGDTTAYNPGAITTACEVSATGSYFDPVNGGYTFALANDPGGIVSSPPTVTGELSGYAFIAGTATELNDALKAAFYEIKQARYCFSMGSVASSRLQEENFIYEASFLPKSAAFWPGYLRKYEIDGSGNIIRPPLDAGDKLKATPAAARKIWTYKSGAMREFITRNIIPEDLGL